MKILVHYVFIPDQYAGQYDAIDSIVETYMKNYAFNIDGIVERFIPSHFRDGIETIILDFTLA